MWRPVMTLNYWMLNQRRFLSRTLHSWNVPYCNYSGFGSPFGSSTTPADYNCSDIDCTVDARSIRGSEHRRAYSVMGLLAATVSSLSTSSSPTESDCRFERAAHLYSCRQPDCAQSFPFLLWLCHGWWTLSLRPRGQALTMHRYDSRSCWSSFLFCILHWRVDSLMTLASSAVWVTNCARCRTNHLHSTNDGCGCGSRYCCDASFDYCYCWLPLSWRVNAWVMCLIYSHHLIPLHSAYYCYYYYCYSNCYFQTWRTYWCRGGPLMRMPMWNLLSDSLFSNYSHWMIAGESPAGALSLADF